MCKVLPLRIILSSNIPEDEFVSVRLTLSMILLSFKLMTISTFQSVLSPGSDQNRAEKAEKNFLQGKIIHWSHDYQ